MGDYASICNANLSNAFMPESKFKHFSVGENANLEKVDFFKNMFEGNRCFELVTLQELQCRKLFMK